MPQALRKASKQNCYRMDGTLSGNRSYRERRARNRLRRDMIAVMVLVFLTGNALYFTIDSRCGVSSVFAYVNHRVFGQESQATARPLGVEGQAEMRLVTTTGESTEAAALQKVGRDVPWIVTVSLVWLLGCCVVVGFGAFRAYREFAAGVNARAAEHFHLDMTRMSVSDVDIVNQLLQPDSTHGAA